MQPVKSFFGVIGALLPVAYFGGLGYYFYRTNEAMGGLATKELGPTILGLGAIGVLFTIPLLIKLVRMFSGASAAKPAKAVAGAAEGGESDFDADAVFARYMARRSAEGGHPPVSPPAPGRDPAAPRPSFGRKIG
jgi:hypothetical protein